MSENQETFSEYKTVSVVEYERYWYWIDNWDVLWIYFHSELDLLQEQSIISCIFIDCKNRRNFLIAPEITLIVYHILQCQNYISNSYNFNILTSMSHVVAILLQVKYNFI